MHTRSPLSPLSRNIRKSAFWVPLLLGAGVLAGAGCATTGPKAELATPPTRTVQANASPEAVMTKLQAGNQRFVTRQTARRDWNAQVQQTSAGQYPLAAFVSCIDSRAPAELIFDQGLGDIFNVRIAGNVINEDVLGSLEFAAKISGVPLIVVLGHTHCGAIKGAIDGAELGHLTGLLTKIGPSADEVRTRHTSLTPNDGDQVTEVAEANVRHAMNQIRNDSAVLRELIDAGSVQLVGAMYDVETGVVAFLD